MLYDETDPEQVKTLAGIEVAVRDHWLEHVGPEIGNFLSAAAAARLVAERGTSRASFGRLSLTQRQSQRLEVKAYTQWSPHAEKCCLLLSANEVYARAAENITVLTGVQVSGSTQQRLVHRQDLEPPAVDGGVKEMSLDGGKVRLRTPEGQPCQWRDYKGVNLHQCSISAFYKDNDSLVNWVNTKYHRR